MDIRLGDKFKLVERIGSGAFGTIYCGYNIETNEEVAVKLEPLRTKRPKLLNETKLYKVLQGHESIPRIHWYGVCGDHSAMVMDLLGLDLQQLLEFFGGYLPASTVLTLALKLVSAIEHLHSKGYIHRDIKPENFLVGKFLATHTKIYMIDLGLSKRYREVGGKHILYKETGQVVGTLKFTSVNSHVGIEQSRRDDLESIGLLLVYLYKGELPWENEKDYYGILEKKWTTSNEELCKGMEPEFLMYMDYCRLLGFDDNPDYNYLKGLFTTALARLATTTETSPITQAEDETESCENVKLEN